MESNTFMMPIDGKSILRSTGEEVEIIDSRTKILRTYSGKAHDAINVYCVRTDERKVYVIRVGADFRNDGQAQVMTSFEY